MGFFNLAGIFNLSNSNDNSDCNEYEADGTFAGNYQRPCAEGKTYWRTIYQMIKSPNLKNGSGGRGIWDISI